MMIAFLPWKDEFFISFRFKLKISNKEQHKVLNPKIECYGTLN